MATPRERVTAEIDKAWQALDTVLAEVPSEHMDAAGVVDSWSVKDLVGHISTWESEMMENVRRFLDPHDGEMRRYPDVDAFNERTVRGKRDMSLDDLVGDLEKTHKETVEFVRDLPEGAFEMPEVDWRIRIDTYEHYSEHGEHIRDWLTGARPDRDRQEI